MSLSLISVDKTGKIKQFDFIKVTGIDFVKTKFSVLSKMTLKLITFDVTGTILTLRQSVGCQYAKIGSLYGLNASADKLSQNFRLVFKSLSAEHKNFGEGCIGWEAWWKKLVSLTFQYSLHEEQLLTPQCIDKISAHLIEIYKTEKCWKLTDGALDTLKKLSETKRLGVLSNYDPRLEDILVHLKVRDYFGFVVTSYTAKHSKPHIGIFKAVEEINTDIEKCEILHIGDNPKLDFIGAQNAGWNALLVTNNMEHIMESYPNIKKEWMTENLSEVNSVLESKGML